MSRTWLAVAAALAIVGGCKDKKSDKDETAAGPPANVEGLEAVPAGARVVIGIDVPKLAGSVLVGRAIERMWDRDPELKNRIDGFIKACQVDPAEDISSIVLAMGKSEDVMMVATGQFVESEIAVCIEKALGSDGGRLTTSAEAGRTLYKADSGPDKAPVWFAFGSDRTFLVSSSDSYLRAAVGSGAKATTDAELGALIRRARVDEAAVWGVGEVPGTVGQGLERASAGKATAPRSIFGHLRLGDGVDAELGAVMGSAEQAKSLESFGKSQLDIGALAAAKYGLTPVVRSLSIEAAESTVLLKLSLTHAQLRDLLSRIDTSGSDEQNPSLDAGTGAPRDDEADAAAGDE